MHRCAIRTLTLVVAVVGLGLSGLRPATAQPPTDDALVAMIDQFAAEALKQPGAAGLSIAVSRGDAVILSKGYGMADLEHSVPATEATLFRIASVTKQFTAAAIMKLMEQGKLGLDDDITKYIDYPTQGNTVTIRHLLTHTSGIKNYTEVPDPLERTSILDVPPEEVLAPVRDLPFEFAPGAQRAYSNTGYHLLGMIIEKVSGVSYAKYLQDEFFTPLHLAHTRYDSGAEIIPGRARGYREIDGALANAAYANMSVPFAAGSLLSTAGDLVAWHRALAGGRAVCIESYLQMTTPATLTDGSVTDYGFGLRMTDFDGHPRVAHSGGIHGFNSVLEYYPQDKLSIAVISNSESMPSALLAKQIAYQALGIAPQFKDLSVPAAELEALTGNYRVESIRLDFVVTAVDGKVKIQGSGEPAVPIMAQGGGEFRAAWDPSLKIVFDSPTALGEKAHSFTLEQGGETFKAVRVP